MVVVIFLTVFFKKVTAFETIEGDCVGVIIGLITAGIVGTIAFVGCTVGAGAFVGMGVGVGVGFFVGVGVGAFVGVGVGVGVIANTIEVEHDRKKTTLNRAKTMI